jgi:adenine-specific DNA-methyltransferase
VRLTDFLIESTQDLSPAPEPTTEPLKSRARTLAASMPPKLRLAYAQSFVTTIVSHYWSKLTPRPTRTLRPASSISPRPIDREAMALAAALAELAALRSVDDAAYLVGSTYAAMLPDGFRSEHGVFYTPPAVVRRLLDSASAAGVDWDRARVLDPACGGGAFLGPVARKIVASLKGCDRRVTLRSLSNRLAGFEIDPFAAWMSLSFLDATLNDLLGFSGDDQLSPIKVCDSLTQFEAGNFDLVVGNPPYGRVTLPLELRSVYKRSLFGHANLYGLFLDLAVRQARAGGVVAYVTPTSFLCGEYYKNLRALLAAEAAPVALDFVSERSGVFDDVLQETLLAVFRRGQSGGKLRVYFVEVDGPHVDVSQAVDVPLPRHPDQPWIMPRARSAARTAAGLRAMPDRLADWGYRVSTGPLVWNRFKDRLREHAQRGTVPLIWAEAISADGEFSFRAARRNHSPYFAVRDDEDFLLVRKSCVLLQRTTAKEQVRRLIAAELPQAFLDKHGAVTVENHLNMIIPIVPKPAVEASTLAAFLNSSAADRAFRCISGTVAVSAYELESMPLPHSETLAGLTKLLRHSPSRQQIEQACDLLYGDR